MQWLGPGGVRRVGGAVAAELLWYQPNRALRLLGRLCETAVARPLIAVAYRWVAAHRERLPAAPPCARFAATGPLWSQSCMLCSIQVSRVVMSHTGRPVAARIAGA